MGTPSAQPSASSPQRANVPAEYFPRIPDPTRPPLPHSDSAHPRLGSSSSAATGALSSGTVPGTSTIRPPIGVRARLSSLGQAHGRALAQLRSPIATDPVQSPLSANSAGYPCPRPTKKVSSSSTLTLQGPKKTRSPLLRPLSSTSSRAGSSSDGGGGEDDTSDEEDSEDEARKEEEIEKQESLARKLKELEKLMTKDALGLVAEPTAPSPSRLSANGTAGSKSRGRVRPSLTHESTSSPRGPRNYSRSRSQSHQSLSSASVDSPNGSIPSIPSPSQQGFTKPYTNAHTHMRHHSQGSNAAHTHHHPPRSQSQSQSLSSHSLSQPSSTSHSSPRSPPRISSPMPVARHLVTPEKSSSPPALSPGSARGHTTNARTLHRGASGLAVGTPTTGSEASSFSDLSGE